MQNIMQWTITAILIDEKPFTMLCTVTYELDNISMPDSINVVY